MGDGRESATGAIKQAKAVAKANVPSSLIDSLHAVISQVCIYFDEQFFVF